MTPAQQQSTQNRTFPHDLCFFLFFVRKQNVQSGGLPVPWVAHVHPWGLEVWRGPRLSWRVRRERQSWLWWDWLDSSYTAARHIGLTGFSDIIILLLFLFKYITSVVSYEQVQRLPERLFSMTQFSYYWPRLDSVFVVPHKSWLSPQLLCSGQSKVAVTACPISGLLALLTWLDSDSIGAPVFCCFQLLCQILLALL